jgi:hypothetical protein
VGRYCNRGCAAAQVGSAGLLALAPLTRLTALTAGQVNIRDGALRMLRGLPALQLLNLASNDVTDAGAAGPGARRRAFLSKYLVCLRLARAQGCATWAT